MPLLPLLAGLLVALSAPARGHSEQVKINNLHMCCKACAKAMEEALDVDGVYDVKVDREAKSVVVETDAPEDALRALERAGFHGRIEGPDVKVETKQARGKDAKSFKLVKAHLCCANCQKVLVAAIRTVPNVEAVEIEDDVATVTAKTGGMNPADVLEAVYKAGFHALVEDVKE